MKNFGIIDSQIQYFDGCAKALKESAGGSYYKDAVSRYFPNETQFGAAIDFQQAILNSSLLYGAANSEACATFLRALSADAPGRPQE
jgi:hypothetical protein